MNCNILCTATEYKTAFKYLRKCGKERLLFVLIRPKVSPKIIALCEYTKNPIFIQKERPRFSWRVESDIFVSPQKKYHIWVSRTADNFCNENLLWDSGEVAERRSLGIIYDGERLAEKTTYFWKVKIICEDGYQLESDIQFFHTAMMSLQTWTGTWIQSPAPQYGRSPLFRRIFHVDDVVNNAFLYISGLGYYKAYLNGKPIGDRCMDPGWTDYNKRVLYGVYDITKLLIKGDNVLAVMLGEGRYGHQHESFQHYLQRQAIWGQVPILLYDIDIQYNNGTNQIVHSGEGADNTTDGPILMNNIYDGEIYDATLEIEKWQELECETSGWHSAVKASSPPSGNLIAQALPPIRRIKRLKPISVIHSQAGTTVYDFGQNIAGWCHVICRGVRGGSITCRYAEILSNNHVNQDNLRRARSTDTYKLKGRGQESFEPSFTYHGFRYIEVSCTEKVEIIEVNGIAVHSDVEQTGTFICSNDVFNWIENAYLWTEKNNLHSVPTDCPQRDERMGWLNDMTVRSTAAIYNFDLMLFYEKWLQDIADQQLENGAIPDTAPYVYGSNPAIHVSSCFIIIPYLLYIHYGDTAVLNELYSKMKRYIQFLDSQLDDRGLIAACYLGDWASPVTYCRQGDAYDAIPFDTPQEIVTTGYLYYDCKLMEEIAMLCGYSNDIAYYRQIRTRTMEAINRNYFHPHGYYALNSQGSNIFPLFLGIVPQGRERDVFHNLLFDIIDKGYHITTGNQMTKYLYDVLDRYGANDIGVKLASSTTYPSFGYMMVNQATTIWERWENCTSSGMNSHNHPMNAAFSSWFYNALAGIRLENGILGDSVVIHPDIHVPLEYVSAQYRTHKGIILSSWSKRDEEVKLIIEIPWNLSAELRISLTEHLEDGNYLSHVLKSGHHELIFNRMTNELTELI